MLRKNFKLLTYLICLFSPWLYYSFKERFLQVTPSLLFKAELKGYPRSGPLVFILGLLWIYAVNNEVAYLDCLIVILFIELGDSSVALYIYYWINLSPSLLTPGI